MTDYTFSFVDLAGYTAATSIHGDVAGADLAEKFAELAVHSAGPDDRLVKSIGDEVMLVSASPVDALRMVSRLCRIAGAEADFPLLRAGLHRGPAEPRGNDFFGSSVNIAARVTGLAQPGELLVTATVVSAAEELEMTSVELGPRQLKNVLEPVDVFRVELGCCGTATLDPVCQMRTNPETAHAVRTHGDESFYFCSPACLREFERDASRFVSAMPQGQ